MNPNENELERIKSVYKHRRESCQDERYSLKRRHNWFIYTQRLKDLLKMLEETNIEINESQKLLEIGCGQGQWLADFVSLGMRPEHLHGIELDSSRAEKAKARLPHSDVREGDASSLPWPDASFDLVLQSTVFTSVLDKNLRAQIASEMLRVLKPGGMVVWYDFFRDNPYNASVKAVSKKEIHELYPNCSARFKRVTLAPPITRVLVEKSWTLCVLLEKLVIFNTHYLGVIRK